MFIVVTGGSGSGKSAYAERRIAELSADDRFYIATMENRDEESRKRIARHRNMRADKHFTTVECPRDLQDVSLSGNATVLLECMSNLCANELFAGPLMQDPEETARKIIAGVEKLCGQVKNLVIVTNEVFSDGMQADPWTESYLSCLGSINRSIAGMADEVVEVVYSVPVFQKR